MILTALVQKTRKFRSDFLVTEISFSPMHPNIIIIYILIINDIIIIINIIIIIRIPLYTVG